MRDIVLVRLLFIAGVQSVTVSKLTDEVSQNSTYHNLNEISANNVDVFRQLLNQETLIRINLVKNIHALMKDMLTLQEKLTVTEGKTFIGKLLFYYTNLHSKTQRSNICSIRGVIRKFVD